MSCDQEPSQQQQQQQQQQDDGENDSSSDNNHNNEPLLWTMAVVYDSLQNPVTCGCRMSLEVLVQHLQSSASSSATAAPSQQQQQCPLCHKGPIALIQDCFVERQKNESYPCITFKYGKQVYQLSLNSSSSLSMTKNMVSETGQQPAGWHFLSMLWFPFHWLQCVQQQLQQQQQSSSSSSHRKNKEPMNSVQITAQERIAQVLGMSVHGGLKILYKGKVLYPPHGNSQSSSSSSQQQQDENEISQRLVELSTAEWSKGHKVPLLVMGTVLGRQLEDHRQRQQQQQPFASMFWNFFVQTARHWFWYSFEGFQRLVWISYTSAVRPLLCRVGLLEDPTDPEQQQQQQRSTTTTPTQTRPPSALRDESATTTTITRRRRPPPPS